MKIVDLLNEAPPGVDQSMYSKYVADPIKQKLATRRAEKQTQLAKKQREQLVKQNQKKWYAVVKRKQQQGINMKDENVYRKELYNFVSGNKKLPIEPELRRLVGTARLSDQTILDIMDKTIDARIAAKEKLANAPKLGQGNPPASGGTP